MASSSKNDPKLLYAFEGVKAYHIANGREEALNTSGAQVLSMLMVPTSYGSAEPVDDDVEEDFYLHLHLPPELDLPLPATTQIYHQPPTSYLIPRWDLGPDSGAFTRIEFPALESRPGIQDEIDTFETIIAQCTSFLERTPAPKNSSSKSAAKKVAAASLTPSAASPTSSPFSSRPQTPSAKEPLPAYDPGSYKPGEAYAKGSKSAQNSRIVLVDEEDGSVVGELSEGYQLVEDALVKPGSKEPVEISLPSDGSQRIQVTTASPETLEDQLHPAYKKSTLVRQASRASRLIITTSDLVVKALETGANSINSRTSANTKPMTFNPATHERIRRINTLSTKAASLSATTVGTITKAAQNFGAQFSGGKTDTGVAKGRGYDKDGNLKENYKPGFLNKSLMAFSTVADGVEKAGKNLLQGTTASAATVVEKRWGPEAGEMTRNIGGGFKNVGLVYIDVAGVSRRAVLKSVAKGMVVGRVAEGGGDIVVGGGDGGVVMSPEELQKQKVLSKAKLQQEQLRQQQQQLQHKEEERLAREQDESLKDSEKPPMPH